MESDYMFIYIILILGIIGLGILFRKNKFHFCLSVGMLFFILVAFRSITIGLYDTEKVYYPAFLSIQNIKFRDILTNATFMTSQGAFNCSWLNGKLFFLITKIISMITENYQFYLAIVGLPYIAMVVYIVYKYSEKPIISMFLFLALYYLYSFFLVRQVLAMTFILFSYKYLREKKFWPFAICVLLATLFHQTAAIFIIAYPLCRMFKFGKKNFLGIFLCYVVANVFPQIIYFLIEHLDFTGNVIRRIHHGIYKVGSGVSMFGLVITVFMLLFAYYYKRKEERSYENDILFHLSSIGSMIYCFSSVVGEFYRLSLFFSIFNILLVSNYFVKEKNPKLRMFLLIGIISVSSVYFLTRSINNTNSNPYQFYWSDVGRR